MVTKRYMEVLLGITSNQTQQRPSSLSDTLPASLLPKPPPSHPKARISGQRTSQTWFQTQPSFFQPLPLFCPTSPLPLEPKDPHIPPLPQQNLGYEPHPNGYMERHRRIQLDPTQLRPVHRRFLLHHSIRGGGEERLLPLARRQRPVSVHLLLLDVFARERRLSRCLGRPKPRGAADVGDERCLCASFCPKDVGG
jgi:hypothetical protein